jgi:oxalate decarboxylase/phosphoglucose isomerase-like protein (cupin superfamily)
MDIFLKSLSDFKWETSSKERVASGANPNSQWKHLVDRKICESKGISVGYGKIPKGEDLPLHNHEPQEIYFIVEGSGFLLMDNKIAKAITKGDIVYIPENEFHGVRNSGNCDLEFLFIFTTDTWENIKYNFRRNDS